MYNNECYLRENTALLHETMHIEDMNIMHKRHGRGQNAREFEEAHGCYSWVFLSIGNILTKFKGTVQRDFNYVF